MEHTFFKELTKYYNLKGICKSCVDLFLCMLFNQGSHGFIKTHRWNRTIRAFINIEASGSGGTGNILHLFIMCFVLLKATRVQDQVQILFWLFLLYTCNMLHIPSNEQLTLKLFSGTIEVTFIAYISFTRYTRRNIQWKQNHSIPLLKPIYSIPLCSFFLVHAVELRVSLY